MAQLAFVAMPELARHHTDECLRVVGLVEVCYWVSCRRPHGLFDTCVDAGTRKEMALRAHCSSYSSTLHPMTCG